MSNLKDIRLLDSEQLRTYFAEIGEPAFRARQVEEWIWQKGAQSFDEMTNLSLSIREKLSKQYSFYYPKIETVQKSSDGTIKLRLQLFDGHMIESVLIPVTRENRYTVCVSSQAGCSLNCSFCATGKMGLLRQLTAAEIVDQVRIVWNICLKEYDANLTNVVFMGMGEPLLNYRQVAQSIHRLTDEIGLGMSARRLTISTAGIAKMIKKLADDSSKVNLALSLHAANDTKRNEIMPINESNNLSALMDALSYYYRATRNRISYEYIALRDFNDRAEDADQLIQLCQRFPVRVNIIEYNPIGDGLFQATKDDTLDAFMRKLSRAGVTVTLRKSRGKDIDAACGQLANKS